MSSPPWPRRPVSFNSVCGIHVMLRPGQVLFSGLDFQHSPTSCGFMPLDTLLVISWMTSCFIGVLSLASVVSSPWDVLAFSSRQQTSKRCSEQLEASVAYFGRFTYHFPGFQQYLVCMCMYYSILLDITTMLESPGPDWEELASLPDQQKNHSAPREVGSWEHKRILWEPMVSMEDPT